MTYLEVTFDGVSMEEGKRASQGEKKKVSHGKAWRHVLRWGVREMWAHRPGNWSDSCLSSPTLLPRSHHHPPELSQSAEVVCTP